MTDHSAGIHSAVTAAETSTDARRRTARTYTYVVRPINSLLRCDVVLTHDE